jgi:hypothetical protein
MSALGQKRTFALQIAMSALPPKADMCVATRNVPLRAKSGHQRVPIPLAAPLVQCDLNIRGRQIGIAGTFLQEHGSEKSGCRAEHHIKSWRYRYAGRCHEERRKTPEYHDGHVVGLTKPGRTHVRLKLFCQCRRHRTEEHAKQAA